MFVCLFVCLVVWFVCVCVVVGDGDAVGFGVSDVVIMIWEWYYYIKNRCTGGGGEIDGGW